MIRWFLREIKDQFFVKLSNFVSVTLKRIVGVLTRLSDAGVDYKKATKSKYFAKFYLSASLNMSDSSKIICYIV